MQEGMGAGEGAGRYMGFTVQHMSALMGQPCHVVHGSVFLRAELVDESASAAVLKQAASSDHVGGRHGAQEVEQVGW